MSRERLSALRKALLNKGWVPYPDPESGSLFSVHGEKIYWRISRDDGLSYIALEFWINGSMGERSQDLADIYECAVKPVGPSLLFTKITGSTWDFDLREFVDDIEGLAKLGKGEYPSE